MQFPHKRIVSAEWAEIVGSPPPYISNEYGSGSDNSETNSLNVWQRLDI